MATRISINPEETEALGREWAQGAFPGLVIGLCGDLGAGKTRLVKGLAAGLGITGRVQSPTFALVNVHESGRLPLAHIDLYRLETLDQIHGAGLDEFLQPHGITVIEWADRWFGESPRQKALTPLPSHYRHVLIQCLSENERRISYEDFGI